MITSSFEAPAEQPHVEWPYVYQSAGNVPQPLAFHVVNTGPVALNIVTRVEPSLTGKEVFVPGSVASGKSSTYLKDRYSVRIAAVPAKAANGDYIKGFGTISIVNPEAAVISSAPFIAPRNVQGLNWPSVYDLAGNALEPNRCLLLENTSKFEWINVIARVEPALAGREVHIDPPIAPGSCLFVGSVYSVRVAANENDAGPAQGIVRIIAF